MKKAFLVLAVSAAAEAASAGEFVRAQGALAIPGCYIVVLKPGATVKAGAAPPG